MRDDSEANYALTTPTSAPLNGSSLSENSWHTNVTRCSVVALPMQALSVALPAEDESLVPDDRSLA